MRNIVDRAKESGWFMLGSAMIILSVLVYLSGEGILNILGVLLGILKFILLIVAFFTGLEAGSIIAGLLPALGFVFFLFDVLDEVVYKHTKMTALVLLCAGVLLILIGFVVSVIKEHLPERKEKKNKKTKQKKEKDRIITFGSYVQRENADPQPIEWIVLRKKHDRMLLLSKYLLDSQRYHNRCESVTWETCSLRRWLNKDFYDEAFSPAEKEKIILARVPAQSSSKYRWTKPGKSTEDKVFILSERELKANSKRGRRYYAPVVYRAWDVHRYSPYNESKFSGAGYWWLRNPGRDQKKAMYTYIPHELYDEDVDSFRYGVRPAIWVRR